MADFSTVARPYARAVFDIANAASALAEKPDLADYSGFVQDSGEGRWTVMTAVEEAVPAAVLSAALYSRFRSRQARSFADRVLSAMRHKFGGHTERPTGG